MGAKEDSHDGHLIVATLLTLALSSDSSAFIHIKKSIMKPNSLRKHLTHHGF